jgi:hypothetical protein
MLFVVFSLSAALLSGQLPAPAASTARISGRVVAEGDHTPLVGAHVTLIPFKLMAGPFGPALQAVTDQDGRYVFENLAPGSYRIQAQRPGFAIRTDFMTMRALDVTDGQKLDNADIELTRGGAIAGRIVDPFGEPLVEVHVMVMRRVEREGTEPQLAPGGGQGQQTNDLGEFRIYGLAPGTYFVAATPRPASLGAVGIPPTSGPSRSTTIATTFYPGTRDQSGAQAVTVTAGDTTANVSFMMQSTPAFSVAGIVVDDTGGPVHGAMVMLMGDPRSGMMGPAGSVRTEDSGRFVIGGVAPGSYRVMASVPMMMGGSGGGGGVSSGVAGGVIGGVSGGVSGAVAFSSSYGTPPSPPTEVTVVDADINGLRVIVRR